MKTIHLARNLTLPAAELATKVFGSFGIRGSGKSNLMAVVVEGMLAAKVQVIVLDPVGIWFSLRLQPDGKTPSPYQIPVLGGVHGDIALQPTAGGVVGRALAHSNDSCVLDISRMTKGQRTNFAADFFESFYEAKKEHPAPTLICAEEAQRIAPQIMFKGSGLERLLGAVEEYAEQARNYGGGLMLNTLRPQKVNKDITSLMEIVFSFRLKGVHERKAVREWVQEKGAPGREAIDTELPSLPDGNAFVWAPAAFEHDIPFGKYHFHKKGTYDAGATPLYARAKVKMRPLDLAALENQMHEIVEKAKADDPRALKARIGELERELAKKPTAYVPVERPAVKTVPMFSDTDLRRVEQLADKLRVDEAKFSAVVAAAVDRLAQAQQAIVSEIGNLSTIAKRAAMNAPRHVVSTDGIARTTTQPERYEKAVQRAKQAHKDWTEKDIKQELAPINGEHEHLPDSTQRMLGALRQGEAMKLTSMPWKNVAVIAGVAPRSGTTSNRKGTLVRGGYITVQGADVALTDKGREYPLDVALPPDDPEELLKFWQREIGTEKIASILETVVHQGPITNEELAAAVGMEARSGTYSNYKGALTRRGLIERQGDAYVPTEVFRR